MGRRRDQSTDRGPSLTPLTVPAVLGDLLQKVMGSSAVANMEEAAVDRLLGLVASLPSDLGTHDSEDWNSLFAIGIKPFMDAYTYDQDRIDKCCVHIISAEGKPVSFCEYKRY